MTAEIRIISWNLLHTKGAKLDSVAALILRHQPDLLLMQEATAEIDGVAQRTGGHYARLALPGRHHGLAAWSPQPLRLASLVLPRGFIVRRVCQIINLGPFSVANVHLSDGQMLNRRQLRRVAAALPPNAAIVGHCNMVGASFLPGFRDAGARQPTHRMQNIVPLRLDRCFTRGLRCISAEVLEQGASDHRPLKLLLERDDRIAL